MEKEPLLEAIRKRRLFGDDPMGTELMLAGLEQGGCGEAWNLTQPDGMLAIQRRYAEAGVNILGSCCGSAPGHTRAIRRMVDSRSPARNN
jgi:methionine synthase I (cobalamin-dependent)